MTVKGLILSGGKGTRLRPLTFTRAKQLIPIGNKPNLFYVLEDMAAANVTDIGVIISPETGDDIRQALGDGDRWGVRLTFIVQDAPLGLAHAAKTARGFLGDSPFLMYLGDNLLSGGVRHLVDEYRQGKSGSLILLTPVDNPSQFGVAEVDERGDVVRLVEKPAHPPSNLALVGVYLLSPRIHEVIDRLKPSGRGEYEITDAIQGLIDGGDTVSARRVAGWWKDTGSPSDLLEANALVLSLIAGNVLGEVVDSQIHGEVVVEQGARIVNSTITGPAHIASGAVLEDVVIGPNTSIGPKSRVSRSRISNSIVLHEARVKNVDSRIVDSVIGQGVTISGNGSAPADHEVQLVLGDFSHVRL